MVYSVCFLALEYFQWGRYGGIGKATRDIASGLSERGLEVHAVIPLGKDQKQVEEIDDVTIHGFPMTRYDKVPRILRKIDADIYHSQDPTPGTVLAMKVKPDSIHVMTCQNPKTREDWSKVNQYYPLRRRLYNTFLNPYVESQVKKLDRVYTQCNFIREKTKDIFGLSDLPDVLPNPVKMREIPLKSEQPKICFLGRLDGEKNPEKYFELASKYPDIEFVAAGKSHNQKRDRELRKRHYGSNVSLPGHVSGEDKYRLLDSSWILVNTSVSECLPVSFLEASASNCAILSPHDPDGFASNFGYRVNEDYVRGLDWLLNNDNWSEQGRKGREYVENNHEYEKVIGLHVDEYERLLD